ncbi:MAG: hypothetical protein ACPGYV_14005, partial [Phycisphaeraceae bacterium]
QRDGSHNALLVALRRLEDPALLPLFRGLSNAPFPDMRAHGRLGAAALSPQRRIDLADLAEIEDQRELVQLLSAAMDDKLIDRQGMTTLLTWDGLDLPLRQAIALRVLGLGGDVDIQPFRASLDLELSDDVNPARLLQYAIAGLLLAESDDDAGRDALKNLLNLKGDTAEAVIGQVLDTVTRQGFDSAGPLAVMIASDTLRSGLLRLRAIQAALRLQVPTAEATWTRMFESAAEAPVRVRLAMIALDAATEVKPELFDALNNEGAWIERIANTGRAISSDHVDLPQALEPLIAIARPLSTQWLVTHVRRDKPPAGPSLLQSIVRHHHAAEPRHRGRITQTAIDAATALAEVYPDFVNQTLAQSLNQPDAAEPATTTPTDRDLQLARRQVLLLGLARAQGQGLEPFAQALEPDDHNDFTTDALRLFIRAKHDAPLTEPEWNRVSDIVQGVGGLDTAMRLQLAWAYLKHKNVADQAIAAALK